MIGLLADVHANIDALRTVLATLAARGIDQIYCAGDLVGYNAAPKMKGFQPERPSAMASSCCRWRSASGKARHAAMAALKRSRRASWAALLRSLMVRT